MVNRYKIERQLGIGRAGAVFEAQDTELNRQVALRRFDIEKSTLDNPRWRDRFLDIVRDLGRINHANILSVLDAGIDQDGPYLVSAHVQGLSLGQILKEKGKLEIDELYDFTRQCLDALQATEEYGYYHHALSPSSILAMPKASRGYHYMLMDLGHSRLIPLIGGDALALSKTLDPALMAPEVYEGNPKGIKSTLYMLGHLIYWLTAGGHPLAGHSLELAYAKHKAGEIPFLKAYRADFPERFRQWLYWLIQPATEHRPKSIADAMKYFPSFDQATNQDRLPQPVPMTSQSYDA